MKIRLILLAVLSLLVAGCSAPLARPTQTSSMQATSAQAEPVPAVQKLSPIAAKQRPRILAMGDSMMAWHGISGRSIADYVARELGEPVRNNSVTGARVIYKLPVTGALGLKIAKQYQSGNWDWIVLNGGGNDLWLGCGCGKCDRKINKMISQDGRQGEIVNTVVKLRQSGAKVVYVGYLRSPGRGSLIEHCREEGAELEARIARLAGLVDGMEFVSLTDMVPFGDRSFHSVDMIHPSLKGSRAIGRRVAAVIKDIEAGG